MHSFSWRRWLSAQLIGSELKVYWVYAVIAGSRVASVMQLWIMWCFENPVAHLEQLGEDFPYSFRIKRGFFSFEIDVFLN